MEQRIEVRDPMADSLTVLANNIGALALAINRLAATQEKPKTRSTVSWSQASYEDRTDAQTEMLREIERDRSGDRGEN